MDIGLLKKFLEARRSVKSCVSNDTNAHGLFHYYFEGHNYPNFALHPVKWRILKSDVKYMEWNTNSTTH